MDTVCTQHPCRLYIVINDAGNPGIAAQIQNRIRQLDQPLCGTVLFPDLQHGDAAVDRLLHLGRQICSRGCDGIQRIIDRSILHFLLLS